MEKEGDTTFKEFNQDFNALEKTLVH